MVNQRVKGGNEGADFIQQVIGKVVIYNMVRLMGLGFRFQTKL
mgnify:FL=1